ncbi:uncharacterized protein LOC128093519 [Culex pipiens pallens]|uniref:uncharacterized protein LOC128093519 n=1 Tax=Culex pipiens pallens TaxID=42434 RepID=UPI0022AAB252|nr:uncharacterized protein LOC128093519 [Culex pipiens pallens]
MLLLSFILVSFLSVIESQSGLILEVMQRERLNVALLHDCNVTSVDFFKHLSTNFSGFIQILQMNSDCFYEDHTRIMNSRHHRMCVIVDLECSGIMKLMEFSSLHGYFNGSYHWILMSRSRLRNVIERMKNQNLNVDSKITIALSNQNQLERYSLFEIFNTVKRQHGKLNVTFIGLWTPDKGLQLICNTKSYLNRKDLKGITLKTAVSV